MEHASLLLSAYVHLPHICRLWQLGLLLITQHRDSLSTKDTKDTVRINEGVLGGSPQCPSHVVLQVSKAHSALYMPLVP